MPSRFQAAGVSLARISASPARYCVPSSFWAAASWRRGSRPAPLPCSARSPSLDGEPSGVSSCPAGQRRARRQELDRVLLPALIQGEVYAARGGNGSREHRSAVEFPAGCPGADKAASRSYVAAASALRPSASCDRPPSRRSLGVAGSGHAPHWRCARRLSKSPLYMAKRATLFFLDHVPRVEFGRLLAELARALHVAQIEVGERQVRQPR